MFFPEQALEYLGRYTHRVAISNNRIISIDNGSVTFNCRDRQRDNEIKEMTLDAHEFIQREPCSTESLTLMRKPASKKVQIPIDMNTTWKEINQSRAEMK